MQTKYFKKLFGFFFITLIFVLVGLFFNSFNIIQSEAKSVITADNELQFDDEIVPYCNKVSVDSGTNLNYFNIQEISISIDDKMGWYSNIFKIISSSDSVIKEEYKDTFNASVKAKFSDENKTVCSFNAEIRISGDWTDHVDKKDATVSMDVKLLSGNIGGITKFKLFKPVARHYDNEIFVSSLMEELGFMSPRTTYTDVKMKDFLNNEIKGRYIFQEKFSKELVEYYGFREGPLIETNELPRWSRIIDNGGDENNIRYFMPAKVLNKYWSRKSQNNLKITLEALEKYNQAIFTSNQPWTQLNYNYLGQDEDLIYKFDAALIALDANHSITNHQRKFYFNKINGQFYPIYYDGATMFLWERRNYGIRSDYENYESLSIAADSLVNEIDIDIKKFTNVLNLKKMSISEEEVSQYIDRFKTFLNSIASEEKTNLQLGENKFLNSNFIKSLNLPEGNVQIVFNDIENQQNEVCNIYLNECSIESFNNQNNDIFELDYFSNENSSFLFGSSKTSFFKLPNKNSDMSETLEIENLVYAKLFSNVDTKIDKIGKTLSFKLNSEDSKVLIYGNGELTNWNIELIGNSNYELNAERSDQNLLTGCLTIYDLKLNDIQINVEYPFCEDGVNIIRSSGTIDTIFVENAPSDALDIDFSRLEINNIVVLNSMNDCVDLSGGAYKITSVDLENCSDKGMSIGEKSKVILENSTINNANIGIAVKDSSQLKIFNAFISNSNFCYALYRKKQEFGPSKLTIGNSSCSSVNEDYVQGGSKLIYEK